ncbi:MAG: hypothetical protein OK457_04995 [Thaumarchaeota archaeon]|nr:hypothetical protein [Nitrososphaerota archaeon]
MSQASEYQRTSNSNGTVTSAKNQEAEKEPLRRVVLTVPLLQIKGKSRKYPGKYVTRGFYVNIPKATVQSMELEEKDQIEITLRKAK